MRHARLKVVASTTRNGLSLRGPKGRGQNDSVHAHINASGFEAGEDVVLISAGAFEEYERMLADYYPEPNP